MSTVYAINGSPRKRGNTAVLLDSALEGAKNAADGQVITERIDLYNLSCSGCRSCFSCKLIGGKGYGKCNIQDGLHPVLEKILRADALIFGSPVYYRNITGMMHSFYERLLFPYTVYSRKSAGIERKHIPTGFLYTMNVEEKEYLRDNYDRYLGLWEQFVGWTFSEEPMFMCAYNTYQFDDYSKYVSDIFDEHEKAVWRERQFPADCEAAYQMGQNLMKKALL